MDGRNGGGDGGVVAKGISWAVEGARARMHL
jgi:hypothetical protein